MKNMKKYLLILASIIIASCASDEKFEELNKDPNNPTSVSSEALFTSATKALFDQMESTNVNNNIYRLYLNIGLKQLMLTKVITILTLELFLKIIGVELAEMCYLICRMQKN